MAISIAVLGSALAGVYTDHMPADIPEAARDSIGVAFELGYADAAKEAFTAAMSAGSWISAGFSVAAALLGLILVRGKPLPPVVAEPEVSEAR